MTIWWLLGLGGVIALQGYLLYALTHAEHF